jgi:hypothetical protein
VGDIINARSDSTFSRLVEQGRVIAQLQADAATAAALPDVTAELKKFFKIASAEHRDIAKVMDKVRATSL